jgi:hypothetical protein
MQPVRSLKPGEFQIKGRLKQLAETSLCCQLDNENTCRKAAVTIAVSKWFDYLIMFIIFLNSICMSMFDYESDNRCVYVTKKPTCGPDSLPQL